MTSSFKAGSGPLIFSLDSGRDFATRVAGYLGLQLAAHEERGFEDGEHKIRPLESVRNRDVYVVQSIYGDGEHSLNDRLVRLLFLLAVLRENGASRLTAVIPYLCYSRKDRKTKSRDPVTSRYLAQLLESMGIDRVVTVDVHNPAAYQNAFRCRAEHLTAHGLLIDHFLPLLRDKDVTVASPDVGGVKRAELFREALAERLQTPVAHAFMEKHRSDERVTGSAVVGEVQARTVLIIDDLIAGGGTMQRAAEAFMAKGAVEVLALASHGVFAARAADALDSPALTRLAVTDSLPIAGDLIKHLGNRLDRVDLSPLVGEAVRRLHEGGALSELEP